MKPSLNLFLYNPQFNLFPYKDTSDFHYVCPLQSPRRRLSRVLSRGRQSHGRHLIIGTAQRLLPCDKDFLLLQKLFTAQNRRPPENISLGIGI